jgi:hypothetical protein
MGTVIAVFAFRGDAARLTAKYDKPLRLAVAREYGLMAGDVRDGEVLRVLPGNPDVRRALEESGTPDPELRIFAVQNPG